MTTQNIGQQIENIKEAVETINSLMAELHSNDVEIRINYKEPSAGEPPMLNLWRAVAHVDYLKCQNNNIT
jgi:hypothetical protein